MERALIVGGGVTGMQVALSLAELGVSPLIVERQAEIGGRVARLARTFPMREDDGFEDGAELVSALARDLARARVPIRTRTELRELAGGLGDLRATLSDGTEERVGAVVLAAGFEPYDPTPLPEYGYGALPDVVTAPELEWMLNPRGPTGGRLRRPSDGGPVRRLAIVFCVGSRNRRIGAPFCSRICCSYSTRQALTVVERHPGTSVACFYMDVRTYDRGLEEMYSRAQERGVTYVRGRVSSVRPLPDGTLELRAENTLLGRPLVGSFDLVSLSTGMRPFRGAEELCARLGLERTPDGFPAGRSWFRQPHDTARDGVFLAGCVTGIQPIRASLVDARAAAARVAGALRARASAPPSP